MKFSQIISCCCSNGLGSSMIVSMNVRSVLNSMGITSFTVRHIPLSDASASPEDLFVVGLDIAPQMRSFRRVIALHDLISRKELEGKLQDALERLDKNDDEDFRIE